MLHININRDYSSNASLKVMIGGVPENGEGSFFQRDDLLKGNGTTIAVIAPLPFLRGIENAISQFSSLLHEVKDYFDKLAKDGILHPDLKFFAVRHYRDMEVADHFEILQYTTHYSRGITYDSRAWRGDLTLRLNEVSRF